MSRPSFRRYHPSAFTPQESLARATQTPRPVRHLGEAVLGWALSNLARDARSPLGNLPETFGFQRIRPTRDLESPLMISLSDHTQLFVTASAIWCTSDDGTTVLTASFFEPMRLAGSVDSDLWADVTRSAQRPTVNVEWVLGWNHAAAALTQLSDYESWVQRRGAGLRSVGERPKAARKTEVTSADLPAALSALAEWASDAEQAMLAWIIAEAKIRGVEADLPERYRRRPIDRVLGLFRK